MYQIFHNRPGFVENMTKTFGVFSVHSVFGSQCTYMYVLSVDDYAVFLPATKKILQWLVVASTRPRSG